MFAFADLRVAALKVLAAILGQKLVSLADALVVAGVEHEVGGATASGGMLLDAGINIPNAQGILAFITPGKILPLGLAVHRVRATSSVVADVDHEQHRRAEQPVGEG